MGLADELEKMNKEALVARAISYHNAAASLEAQAKLCCWDWEKYEASLDPDDLEAFSKQIERLAVKAGLRDQLLRELWMQEGEPDGTG